MRLQAAMQVPSILARFPPGGCTVVAVALKRGQLGPECSALKGPSRPEEWTPKVDLKQPAGNEQPSSLPPGGRTV